jgi:hypothetical protein
MQKNVKVKYTFHIAFLMYLIIIFKRLIFIKYCDKLQSATTRLYIYLISIYIFTFIINS